MQRGCHNAVGGRAQQAEPYFAKVISELVTCWVHWLVRSCGDVVRSAHLGRILVGLRIVEILPVLDSGKRSCCFWLDHYSLRLHKWCITAIEAVSRAIEAQKSKSAGIPSANSNKTS